MSYCSSSIKKNSPGDTISYQIKGIEIEILKSLTELKYIHLD